jgi:hypothetical protein
MITCEMTGCYDMAEYSAEFLDTGADFIAYDICESCAQYWTNHKEESPKITAWKVAQK